MASNMEDDFDYEDDGEFVPPTEEELKRIEERRKRSDKISAELGRRMLQGWGLMGIHCPQEDCFAPLMKEPKTAKLFCVNCNVYVVPEAEYEASKKEQASATSSELQSRSAPVETSSANPTTAHPAHNASKAPTIAATSTSTFQALPYAQQMTIPSLPQSSPTYANKNTTSVPNQDRAAKSSEPSSSPAMAVPDAHPGSALRTAMGLLTSQMNLMNSRFSTSEYNYETSMQVLNWYERCAQAMIAVKHAGHEFGTW